MAKKKSGMTIDFDTAWKEALACYFFLFMRFFFPKTAEQLDETVDYEVLNTTLPQSAPSEKTGNLIVDLLFKVKTKKGDWAYAHVDAQCQKKNDFPRRVYRYNNRLENQYNVTIWTGVLYGDRHPTWRPRSYQARRWGCRKTLHFPTVKLLDYRGKEEQLLQDDNPFGLMVLAHLQTLENSTDAEERLTEKLKLVKNLYGRNLDAIDLQQWVRLLDWMLPLDPERDKRFWAALHAFEQEKSMPFVTSIERIGYDRGLNDGVKRGLEDGIKKGLEDGIKKGLEDGIKKGQEKGKAEALQDTIEKMLPMEQEQRAELLTQVRQQNDASKLQNVILAIVAGKSTADLFALLA